MIRYTEGDLFDTDAVALVNPVNCVGVMGKGLALEFRRHFPENFRLYRARCVDKDVPLKPGGTFLHWEDGNLIINAATKDHWRDPSRIEWVQEALGHIAREVEDRDIKSLALPALGCGNGKLAWAEVKPLIDRHLGHIDCDVTVYEPN